jgi:hypothetical protein
MLLNNCINKLKDKARHIIDFEDLTKTKTGISKSKSTNKNTRKR